HCRAREASLKGFVPLMKLQRHHACARALDPSHGDALESRSPPSPGRCAVWVNVTLSRSMLAVFLSVLSGLAGCTSLSTRSTVPEFTTQSRCERDGNVWYANLGVCSRV